LKVAFLGDIVGKPGRKAVKIWLEKNRTKIDLCIANGENAAAGFGITRKVAEEILSYGVNVITGGNHIWDKKEIFEFIDQYPILRPLNYPEGTPGKGLITLNINGIPVTIINLMGRVFLECLDNPFKRFDEVFKSLNSKIVIVDFHSEATSEKQAFGYYVDGRATAVFGTHTHVRTSDLRTLEKGTLYISDAGMCGALDSVIGMNKKEGIERFVNQLPVKFTVPRKPERIQVSGIMFNISPDGKVNDFEPIYEVYERGEDGNYT
jgi:metallophosphoesterase (TIGR00282 family)